MWFEFQSERLLKLFVLRQQQAASALIRRKFQFHKRVL